MSLKCLHNKNYYRQTWCFRETKCLVVLTLVLSALPGCQRTPSSGPRPTDDLVLRQFEKKDSHFKTDEVDQSQCESKVDLTWVGITNYVARYTFEGKKLAVFLDRQLNGYEYGNLLTTLDISGPDLVIIGHDHFDHTGECLSEGDWLCQLARLAGLGPRGSWQSGPIATQPDGDPIPLLLGPTSICARSDPSPCTPANALEGLMHLRYPKLGLDITVIPIAHSVIFGSPDPERSPPGEGGDDAYGFLIQFPGETAQCRPTLLWTNSLFQYAPSLDFRQSVDTDGQPTELNYRQLLEEALLPLGQRRVDLWATYAYELEEPHLLKPWLSSIRPHAWTNHHHGVDSQAFFPELTHEFDGHPLGGSQHEPASPWLLKASPAGTEFLPLAHYWDTFQIKAGQTRLLPEASDRLRREFYERSTSGP